MSLPGQQQTNSVETRPDACVVSARQMRERSAGLHTQPRRDAGGPQGGTAPAGWLGFGRATVVAAHTLLSCQRRT